MKKFHFSGHWMVNAKIHGKALYIQMDANSKLGPEVIKGDPHCQSENGKL